MWPMSVTCAVSDVQAALPRALSSYLDQDVASLWQVLADRVRLEPFNAIATGIFLLAIVHTFVAIRFTRQAHRVQHASDERAQREGRPATPSVAAGMLHFFGEVQVVFGLSPTCLTSTYC